jgi:hypothetical protein
MGMQRVPYRYEVQVKMRDMSIAYAGILMKEGGDFGKIHNECVFYEALYDFTARVLNTRFDRRLWSTVECELGRLFRGPGFNLAARKRDPQPTVGSGLVFWGDLCGRVRAGSRGGEGCP